MSMLEDENFPAKIYIEPKDNGITDENSGDVDDGGLMDNLCGDQLNTPAELALSGDQTNASDFEKSLSSLQVEQAKEVHKD